MHPRRRHAQISVGAHQQIERQHEQRRRQREIRRDPQTHHDQALRDQIARMIQEKAVARTLDPAIARQRAVQRIAEPVQEQADDHRPQEPRRPMRQREARRRRHRPREPHGGQMIRRRPGGKSRRQRLQHMPLASRQQARVQSVRQETPSKTKPALAALKSGVAAAPGLRRLFASQYLRPSACPRRTATSTAIAAPKGDFKAFRAASVQPAARARHFTAAPTAAP